MLCKISRITCGAVNQANHYSGSAREVRRLFVVRGVDPSQAVPIQVDPDRADDILWNSIITVLQQNSNAYLANSGGIFQQSFLPAHPIAIALPVMYTTEV